MKYSVTINLPALPPCPVCGSCCVEWGRGRAGFEVEGCDEVKFSCGSVYERPVKFRPGSNTDGQDGRFSVYAIPRDDSWAQTTACPRMSQVLAEARMKINDLEYMLKNQTQRPQTSAPASGKDPEPMPFSHLADGEEN